MTLLADWFMSVTSGWSILKINNDRLLIYPEKTLALTLQYFPSNPVQSVVSRVFLLLLLVVVVDRLRFIVVAALFLADLDVVRRNTPLDESLVSIINL